jgi:hypothetical protein
VNDSLSENEFLGRVFEHKRKQNMVKSYTTEMYVKRYFIGKIYGYLSPSFFYFAVRCHCWLLLEIPGG